MFIFFEDEYINTHGGSVPSVIDGQDITEETKNNYTESLFDSIRHINEYGEEYWYARELSKVLEYKDFRNFELTIFKATFLHPQIFPLIIYNFCVNTFNMSPPLVI